RRSAMYRSDDFVVPQVETAKIGLYHDLAEAIRRGCKMRPRKVRGHFCVGEKQACAMGAAFVGMGGDSEKCDWDPLYKLFPRIRETGVHPFSGEKMMMAKVVNELNERSNVSREWIAEWLCHAGGCCHSFEKQRIKPARLERLKGLGVIPHLVG